MPHTVMPRPPDAVAPQMGHTQLDVRCQLRHELQRYVPVGHLRPRCMFLRAMALIAAMAVQRLA